MGCTAQDSFDFETSDFLFSIFYFLFKTLWLAHVLPLILIRTKRDNALSLRRDIQVGVDDGEHFFISHRRNEPGRNDVDARERQRLKLGFRLGTSSAQLSL